jgi:hypothetical protein
VWGGGGQEEVEACDEDRVDDGADASFWEPAAGGHDKEGGGDAAFAPSRGLTTAEAEALLRKCAQDPAPAPRACRHGRVRALAAGLVTAPQYSAPAPLEACARAAHRLARAPAMRVRVLVLVRARASVRACGRARCGYDSDARCASSSPGEQTSPLHAGWAGPGRAGPGLAEASCEAFALAFRALCAAGT